MKIRAGMIALAVGLSANSLAAQETSVGSSENARGLESLATFAACAAEREPEIARDYVIANERIDDDAFAKLVSDQCLGRRGGRLSMNSFALRGAIARELLIDSPRVISLEAASVVPALTWLDAGHENFSETENFVLRLSECIAREAPSAVSALIAAPAKSDAERSSFEMIGPYISGCVPAGEELRLNRTTLRMGLAISYYRLAVLAEEMEAAV